MEAAVVSLLLLLLQDLLLWEHRRRAQRNSSENYLRVLRYLKCRGYNDTKRVKSLKSAIFLIFPDFQTLPQNKV